MRVSVGFRWYDLWVGFYWDRVGRILYFCPLPTVVVMLSSRGDSCES